jgi:demethylmenaquinone methyltransferase / 2-methoxy-6-polyprenyl-1,4-benzoquinol methylase
MPQLEANSSATTDESNGPHPRVPAPAPRSDASRSGNPVPEASVAAMFDGIAPVYDRMNTLMTFARDGRWRRRAVDATGLEPGGSVLDAACGTGKLAAELAARVGPFGRVLAVDLSPGMVARGMNSFADLVQLEFRVGNALALPAGNGEFDAATIGFGMRNLADFEAGFRELRRVVKPGGRVVCLELTTPRPAWWGRLFLGTFRRVAPIAGRMLGRAAAYRYLPASLDGFPDAEHLSSTMRAAGLTDIRVRRMGLRSVALHTGIVPRD